VKKSSHLKHLNIQVIGKVQGVWFRKSTQQKAQQLGLKGFVCNQSDGSVYIEAEATAKKLTDFLEWCQQGPEQAVVEKLISAEAGIKGFDSFDIRH